MSDKDKLYIATESFIGNGFSVAAGVTLLYGDNPIVQSNPQFFRLSEEHARPEVETASAAPGEKRGARSEAKAEDKPKDKSK